MIRVEVAHDGRKAAAAEARTYDPTPDGRRARIRRS
jgi:hypothetical protein